MRKRYRQFLRGNVFWCQDNETGKQATLGTNDRLTAERLLHAKNEAHQVLLLNTRRRLIRVEHIAKGTLDTILVCPREVFKNAITANAAALVLVHNHPSGDPSPSEADIKTTRDLIRAGQLLRIDVLDHVILGQRTDNRPRDFVSLRELGYFWS